MFLVTVGLFLTGCGQQEQGEDTEPTEEKQEQNTEITEKKQGEDTEPTKKTVSEEVTSDETPSEEPTTRETFVKESPPQETTTAAIHSEHAAKSDIETAPPAQATPPPPSNAESQPPYGLTPPQELGVNAVEQDVPNVPTTSPAVSTVFFTVPGVNGATYSCTGGPPFVHNGDNASMGNCAVQQIGPPAGLICDVPTAITFVHDMQQFVADASLCHGGTDTSLTSPEAGLPSQAQPYPSGTEPTPSSGAHQH